jgi:hypothetical protein
MCFASLAKRLPPGWRPRKGSGAVAALPGGGPQRPGGRATLVAVNAVLAFALRAVEALVGERDERVELATVLREV